MYYITITAGLTPLMIFDDLVEIEPLHLTKVQVGNDQEKAQSERNSHSKDRGGKKLN